jgi:hypothetical protein
MYPALVALLAVGPLLAAPAVKGKAVFYHPTRVGDTRVYETTSAATGTGDHTEAVTKVEVRDGMFVVTVNRTTGVKGGVDAVFEVSERGVTRTSSGPRSSPTPVPLIRLPAKEGATWSYTLEPPPGVAAPAAGIPKATYTVGREEDVEVPAGRFRAIRVEMETALDGERRAAATQWHAPGVGVVKSVTKLGPNERTMVLKSFTPGK